MHTSSKNKKMNTKISLLNHDMSKAEREEAKKLLAEAKERQDKSQGKFRYRVKGPPWARRIVRIPVEDAQSDQLEEED